MRKNAGTEEIDQDLFDYLVNLAALELAFEEAEYLRRQLNNQLKAIHELQAIPVDRATQVTSHGVKVSASSHATTRADEVIPFAHPEMLLEQAPEIKDGYVVVPEIPHEDLE